MRAPDLPVANNAGVSVREDGSLLDKALAAEQAEREAPHNFDHLLCYDTLKA